MESDTRDALRWEDAFSVDRETAVSNPGTPVDEEPWAMYRDAGAGTIAPAYVEAYLDQLDAYPGRRVARHRR